ncbi:MAG: hypothetical protein DRG63_04995 [Deltaproteobacteria bacterium]|nr:MAG: hypothetical protein DRG63_04995 [Deltaproteobacteria bacterium]
MNISSTEGRVIAIIQNRENPTQEVAILYVAEENGFVTSGITRHFGVREIFIPAYMVVKDLDLTGTIVAAILEDISQAHEAESAFEYRPFFEVMGKGYLLRKSGGYMMLEEAQQDEGYFPYTT